MKVSSGRHLLLRASPRSSGDIRKSILLCWVTTALSPIVPGTDCPMRALLQCQPLHTRLQRRGETSSNFTHPHKCRIIDPSRSGALDLPDRSQMSTRNRPRHARHARHARPLVSGWGMPVEGTSMGRELRWCLSFGVWVHVG